MNDTTETQDETPPTSEEFQVSQPGNINPEVLQNISVTLSIEVGRTNIKIKDLMRLTQGSVVELDRIAGEPLDLLVNETVVAQGEVVLVNDRYGIRPESYPPPIACNRSKLTASSNLATVQGLNGTRIELEGEFCQLLLGNIHWRLQDIELHTLGTRGRGE